MEKFNLTETNEDKLVERQKLKKAEHITLRSTREVTTNGSTLLLVDLSGSMGGDKLTNLKKALETVWNPGIKAIGFESVLWEIERGDIQKLSNMGSTHMLSALYEGWSSNPDHIVLITDGQPTDSSTSELLQEVRLHLTPPIDTIGIGDKHGRNYNPDFLKEISRLTGGRFIDVDEPIQLTQKLKFLLDYKPDILQEGKKGVIQL